MAAVGRLRLRADRLRARPGRSSWRSASTSGRRRAARQFAYVVRVGTERAGAWCCGRSTRAPTASSARTSTRPATPARWSSPAHYPPLGHRGFATYCRAGRFGQIPSSRAPGQGPANTLVIGMIESPAGCGAAAEILAVPRPGRGHDRSSGPRIASRPDDLDPAVAIDRVHEAATAGGKVRMDIVTGTAPAVRRRRSAARRLQPRPHVDGAPGRAAADARWCSLWHRPPTSAPCRVRRR